MKNLILIISSLIFVSCNSNQSKISKWTDEEKDMVFKECISYAIDQLEDIDKSNDYCYCTLKILTTEFENKADAETKIGNDPSLRIKFEGCKNN
tara:strand:- start:249 stop:530 length:282 start_codon:yes stop_codon:yes gene_type:complete